MNTAPTLLEFLVANELVSPDVVEAAEAELAKEDREVAALEWLSLKGLIEEVQLAIALARHLGLPYVNLVNHPLDRGIVGLISEELASKYQVLALRQDEGGALVLAMADPLDRGAIAAVQQVTRRAIRPAVGAVTAMHDAIARAYHLDSVLSAYLRGVRSEPDHLPAAFEDESLAVERVKDGTALPSVDKLFNLILLDALRSHATEVHIGPSTGAVSVRYRIDGSLRDAFHLPKWVSDSLAARCKSSARLDPTEYDQIQAGRMRVRHRGALIDLWVATLPSLCGENVTLRIVRPLATAADLEQREALAEYESRCADCDQPLQEFSAVCAYCRASLEAACATCGFALQPDWQTCPYCRTRVQRAPLVVTHADAPSIIKPGLPAGPVSADAAPQRRFRVMVVDDEPDFRRIMTVLLEQSGMPVSVSVATSGPDALARAGEDLPDLILLDIMMPDMDGFEVCARLRANVRTTFIPILMLTALNDPASRTRAFLVGTDDYIGKPFDRAELLARVRRVLQRTYGLPAGGENVAATTESSPDRSTDPEPFLSPSNPTVGH